MQQVTTRDAILIAGGCALSISSAFLCEHISAIEGAGLLVLAAGLVATWAGALTLASRLPAAGRFVLSGILLLLAVAGLLSSANLSLHGCGMLILPWLGATLLLCAIVFISGIVATLRI